MVTPINNQKLIDQFEALLKATRLRRGETMTQGRAQRLFSEYESALLFYKNHEKELAENYPNYKAYLACGLGEAKQHLAEFTENTIGEYEAAIDYLNQAIQLAPNKCFAAYRYLADVCQKLGEYYSELDPEQAKFYHQEAIKNYTLYQNKTSENNATLCKRAVSELAIQQDDQAIRDLTSATMLNRDDPVPIIALAQVYLDKTQHEQKPLKVKAEYCKKASEYLDRIVVVGDGSVWQMRLDLAKQKILLGNNVAALEDLEMIIQKSQDKKIKEQAWLNTISCNLNLGDTEKAIGQMSFYCLHYKDLIVAKSLEEQTALARTVLASISNYPAVIDDNDEIANKISFLNQVLKLNTLVQKYLNAAIKPEDSSPEGAEAVVVAAELRKQKQGIQKLRNELREVKRGLDAAEAESPGL